MKTINDYINKLKELDTTQVSPMTHIIPMNNVFREDMITNIKEQDTLIVNAPDREGGFFKVPKVMGV